MKRILILFALSACAPQQPVLRPITVDIPLSSPCPASLPPKPAFMLDGADLNLDLFQKTKAALIEIEQRQAYESRLEALLNACTN